MKPIFERNSVVMGKGIERDKISKKKFKVIRPNVRSEGFANLANTELAVGWLFDSCV